MSQACVADHLALAEKTHGKSHGGISAEGLKRILQGDVAVKVETLLIIAEPLGVTVPELLAEAFKGAQDGPVVGELRVARMAEQIALLTPEAQRFLDIQIDALVRAETAGGEQGGKVARVAAFKANQNDAERELAEAAGSSIRPRAGGRAVRGGKGR
jgi:hypothetical protein